MTQSSDAGRRPTSVLGEASDVMRTLSRPTLTTLYYINNNEQYVQQDIAEVIGCKRATVSQYLQSMKELPLALVAKQGRRYTVTHTGETVLSYVRGMLNRLDIDLHAIEWSDNTETEEIAATLAPFGNARSTAPFLLLYAIGTRSALGDQIELFGAPQSVSLDDIVQDVKTRQQDRGESTTRKQIQTLLRRFDKATTVEYDNPEVVLTEKGHEQANLLEQLVQLLERQNETDNDQENNEEASSSQSSLTDVPSSDHRAAQTTSTSSVVERHGVDNIAQQTTPRGYFDQGRASLDILQETHQAPAIIPAYCLRSAADDGTVSPSAGDRGSGSNSQSESDAAPVLPLTSLTLSELADHVSRLVNEYDEEVEFEPYWALQTETSLQPLSPARLSLDEASHQAWKIINDAHDIWTDQSR